MNSIEYVASILKQEGVEWMACYPSNPLIEAVAKEGIRPVAFRHERGAVMAADGFSRLSDRKRFGVVAMQSQAGAENSVGGLSQAFADNVPILVLPGGNPLDMLFVRPNFFAARTWAPNYYSDAGRRPGNGAPDKDQQESEDGQPPAGEEAEAEADDVENPLGAQATS